MRSFPVTNISLRITAVMLAAMTLAAQQAPQEKEGQLQFPPAQPIPARAAPTDYTGRAAVGKFTIAAEFTGHSVPTSQGPLTSEDYLAVEVAVFGPADAKLKLSPEDFSLRINGAKKPISITHVEMLYKSLKDPEYIVPDVGEKKSKSGMSTGGEKGQDSAPPSPPPIPFEVKRNIAQRAQKAALIEGERPLPVAGVLFFQSGKQTKSIKSVELVYEGPAGKARIALQ